jgi:hypothetical protein
MLGSNTPKYIDYVDTPLESAAFHEKKQALSVVQTASQIIVKLTGLSEEQARRYVIKSWIFLHGIISLHNNRIFAEMDLDTEAIAAEITDDLLVLLRRQCPKFPEREVVQ